MHAFVKWAPAVVVCAGLAACTELPPPTSPDPAVQASASSTAQDRLAHLFNRSWPVVLALPGTVFADHDEAAGRLVFGIEDGAAERGVRTALAALGVPAARYVVEVVEPVHALATLRDRWRPTQGGIQVHFRQFLCTLGFNADLAGEASFVTASHCTNRQGGVEGTQYAQPLRSVDPAVVAIEADDPAYFRGDPCPRGRKCRYSDAARAAYTAGVASTRGAIARTSGANNGSIDVTGSFTITGQDNTTSSFSTSLVVNKVGRTTGWTRGEVTQSCVHTNVAGSNITLLCQTWVADPDEAVISGAGDSGSAVFRVLDAGTYTIELVGILWGGTSSGKTFIFSPLKNVRDELGALVATGS